MYEECNNILFNIIIRTSSRKKNFFKILNQLIIKHIKILIYIFLMIMKKHLII